MKFLNMVHVERPSCPHLAVAAVALGLLVGASTAPAPPFQIPSAERPASTKQVQTFLLKAQTGSVQGGYRATYIESYKVTTPLNPGHVIHLQAIQDTPYLRIYRATPGFRSVETQTAPAGYEVFLSIAGSMTPRPLNAPRGTYTCSQATPRSKVVMHEA